MWQEILGQDFLRRPRLSRIFYNGKFFDYPLKPINALFGLGLWESIRIALSYLRWQVSPIAVRNRSSNGYEPVRQAPFRDLFQVLHREGLGHFML